MTRYWTSQALLLTVLLFLQTSLAKADSIPEIVAKAKPAIVEIVAEDATGKSQTLGTGFFVSPAGLVVTNQHVIDGANSISAISNNGSIFVFEHVVAQPPGVDLAVLKFHATDVPFLKLGESTTAVEGQKVIVIGNPKGLMGTVSDGIISAFRENRSMIQITAPISHGSSGSPVIDEKGQVIGVATLLSAEGQNLNFAIAVEQVSAALANPPNERVAGPTPTIHVKTPLDSGIALFDRQEYDKAISALTDAIRLDPNSALAYCYRGRAYHKKGEFSNAIDDLTESIRLKPDFADAYIHRGLAYLALDQFDEAIADYSETIRLKPDSSAAYYARADAHEGLAKKLIFDEFDPKASVSAKDIDENYSKAIADYTQAIRLNPDNAAAFLHRGQAYTQLRQANKAIADYSEAIRLNPDFADAYFRRGVSYKDIGKYTEAIADLTESVRLKPDYADAYYHRGDVFYQLRQYRQAIADESEAIRLTPTYAIDYFTRGNAYYVLKQYENAVSDYTETIHRLTKYAAAYRNRGAAYYSLGKYENAVSDYTEAIQLDPNDSDAYQGRGRAYRALGDEKRASADFSKAEQLLAPSKD